MSVLKVNHPKGLAMENSELDKELILSISKKLIDQLENAEDSVIEKTLEELSAVRENSLFQELGKLTRELHDSIRNFELDDRFNTIAETEIPDAKERLEYVLTMTEQSADKTLTAVEDSTPIVTELSSQVSDMEGRWSKFIKKELSAEEFRSLASDIGEFLTNSKERAAQLSSNLNTVLMAQDFQDLSGQIIRRVITLVDDVESNLVNLIRLQGEGSQPDSEKEAESEKGKLDGPQIPGKEAEDVMANQDDVDDLLASLGF